MVELTIINQGLEGLLFVWWLSLDYSHHKMFGNVFLLEREMFISFLKGKRYGFLKDTFKCLNKFNEKE